MPLTLRVPAILLVALAAGLKPEGGGKYTLVARVQIGQWAAAK